MRPSIPAVILLSAVIASCSSNSSDPGTAVDMAGTWYLSDSTGAPSIPDGQSNPCWMWNRPVLFTYDAGSRVWVGDEQQGGSLTCSVNGVPGDTAHDLAGPYFRYIDEHLQPEVGDSVGFWVNSVYLQLVGRFRSTTTMSGIIPSTSGNGRTGTWIMRRQQQ